MSNNKDQKTVDGFGDEWERFDQSQLSEDEHQELFNRYFSVFPWEKLPENPTGFDMGCGSGRYFENGQLQYRYNYKAGKEDGLSEFYNENGQLEQRVNYKAGQYDGLYA